MIGTGDILTRAKEGYLEIINPQSKIQNRK